MRRFRLIRFGIKAGITASAVYLTVDNGVWKDNETTGELYQNLQKTIKPYMDPIVDQIPFEIPKLPKTGDMTSTAKTTWNKGVMASCLFLVELPETTWNYLKNGSTYMIDKINEELKALSEESENPNILKK